MAGATNWEKLEKQIEELIKKADKEGEKAQYTIGYRMPYAPYVHENVEMKWQGIPRHSGIFRYWDAAGGRPGTAKFLEHPMRANKDELSQIVYKKMLDGVGFASAIAQGAIKLRQLSKFIVPREYGPLQDSAFVRNDSTGHEYA